MTEAEKKQIRGQSRFKGIFAGEDGRFGKRIALSSSVPYPECGIYISQALEAGLDGTQVRRLEEELAEYIGAGDAIALRPGGTAMRLALKLAAGRLYGNGARNCAAGGMAGSGCLTGKKVFCPDFTAADIVSPVVSEGGEPVFIDSSDEDWSMDPAVLELAFGKHPDAGIVILNHAYGFPGQIERVKEICGKYGALLIECAGEALGAEVCVSGEGTGSCGENHSGENAFGIWKKAGSFGDYAVIDFHAEGILGGNGEALLLQDSAEAGKARRLAFGAKESAPWDQWEAGYSTGMGELDAALLRGQLLHLGEVIERKKELYERYRERLEGDLACLIPVLEGTRPNYWAAAMTVGSSIRFQETREGNCYSYQDVHGTAAPMEIYDALGAFGAQARPVYKPLSMQQLFWGREYFTLEGLRRTGEKAGRDGVSAEESMSREYYESGICLPGDVRMTQEEQERVIEIVRACYDRIGIGREDFIRTEMELP